MKRIGSKGTLGGENQSSRKFLNNFDQNSVESGSRKLRKTMANVYKSHRQLLLPPTNSPNMTIPEESTSVLFKQGQQRTKKRRNSGNIIRNYTQIDHYNPRLESSLESRHKRETPKIPKQFTNQIENVQTPILELTLDDKSLIQSKHI